MHAVGIIAEYNPFHTGHAWHIAETRRLTGGTVVCVMSGNWVQRGECALLDKWTRAGLALAGGADLVLEHPTPWAVSSAERFARGGVGLLAATGVVDTVSFGSEAGALDDLRAAARCLDSADYSGRLRGFLDGGLSFPAARQRAAESLIGPAARCLLAPNSNLGVEYLRAMGKTGLAPLTVLRRGAGHDAAQAEGAFLSAGALRAMLAGGREQEALSRLPGWRGNYDLALFSRCERAVLARLRAMSEGEFAALPDGGEAEGLPARMSACAVKAASLEEFFALAKTKRYPHARLRRMVLCAFLGLREDERPQAPLYLRVLGVNGRGRALLREMKKRAALPVITKPAHAARLDEPARRLFVLEARCTDLYGLCLETVSPGGSEWVKGPVVVP